MPNKILSAISKFHQNRNAKVASFRMLVVCLGLLISCGPQTVSQEKGLKGGEEQDVLVFAAASVWEVLTEIGHEFEEKHGGTVHLNIASSGALARQIHEGGRPDVYISANEAWIKYIDSLGYIFSGSISNVAHNSLVLVSPVQSTVAIEAIDSLLDFPALLGKGRLAMGDPQHVPAGSYAQQSLEFFGWYSEVKPQILPAKDVQAALMYVALGEAPWGIVYQTDALNAKKVKLVQAFPSSSHDPIVYRAGLCNDRPMAKKFYTFLNSEEAKTIWTSYGFTK